MSTDQPQRLAQSDPVATIAQYLQQRLGQRLVAYATDTADPKTIGEYAGGRTPPEHTEARLRDLYLITQQLVGADEPATVRAWMIGMNPDLDDHSPIDALRNGELTAVRLAVEAFLANG